ncbi:MAG: polysaccharide biosynthesis protein [Clostridia bacterium]
MKTKAKVILWCILDIFLINLAIYGAYWVRFDGVIKPQYIKHYKDSFVIITLIKLAVFYYSGLYKSLWKYASIRELMTIAGASVFANAAMISYAFITKAFVPRSIYIIACLLDIALIGGSRLLYRVIRRSIKGHSFSAENKKRVLVIGAGDAGAAIIRELRNHSELNSIPIAIIDDNQGKVGKKINGVPVLGTRDSIHSIVGKKAIEEIIIALPSASKKEISEIIDICTDTRCKLKIVPGVYELINETVTINAIRDVQIEDLLGREPVKVDLDEISGYLTDKVVLVTGGGGSIGSELCRQIAGFNPKKLLILDIYENNAYDIQNELLANFPSLDLFTIIASVRDKARLESIFQEHKPEIVFHAAAHKHVPLMESNPTEAIKNNVFGTLNVVECTHKHNAKKFVLISTDKAVNPTNIMGATKRVAEMIVQAFSRYSKTEFVAVRFGNVLGSNGSVIPLFKKQIAAGGPVTVTHPEINRFFMTIPEAVQLVIQAGAMAKGGEIFVLDMGNPVKIVDLARDLIRLSGFEPDVGIEIKFTGLRPGEKLYEELLMAEEGLTATRHEKIFIGQPIFADLKMLHGELEKLKDVIVNENENLNKFMETIVPTYKHIG